MLGRLLGLLILAIGLGVLYYFLLQPLAQAQAGVAEIRYSLRAFSLSRSAWSLAWLS
jgi:hypothetical protein